MQYVRQLVRLPIEDRGNYFPLDWDLADSVSFENDVLAEKLALKNYQPDQPDQHAAEYRRLNELFLADERQLLAICRAAYRNMENSPSYKETVRRFSTLHRNKKPHIDALSVWSYAKKTIYWINIKNFMMDMLPNTIKKVT